MRSAHWLLPSFLLVLATCWLAPACQSPPGPSKQEKVDMYAENSLRFFYLGEFDRAEEQALKGLELAPRNYDVRLVLGRTLQHRGTREAIARAERLFRELAQEEPKDDRVHVGLGECLERRGIVFDQAAREIETGERLTDAPDPAARVAELREKARSSWQEAHEEFLRAHELKRRTAYVNGLQRTSSLLGRPEESLDWSNVLLELLDEQIRAWKQQLAMVDITSGDEARWRRNLADDEKLKIGTLLFMSSTLANLGRHEDAIATLDQLLEVDPDLPEAYSRRAYHQFRLGQYRRAIDSLDRFLSETSHRPFEDPEIMRAYDLRDQARAQLTSLEGD